jgi:hypothetical protein
MPRYPHNCSSCVPLGEHEEYDLYFCKQGGVMDTVIARYGVDGEYVSGLSFGGYTGVYDNPLKVAKVRAIEQGLMT